MSDQGMMNSGNTQMFAVQLSSVVEDEAKRMSAAEVLAQELGVEPDKVFKLISSAPKKISQAMPQVDAENMAALCKSAGLEVDIIAAQPKRPAPARPQPRPAPVAAQPTRTASAQAAPSRSASSQRERGGASSSSKGGLGGLPPFGTNPYLTMLTRPKDTLRSLLDGQYQNSDLSLAILVSVLSSLVIVILLSTPSSALLFDVDGSLGAEIFIVGLFITIFIVIGGVIGLYFTGFLYCWLGVKLFSGNASYRDARFAYAWALVPAAWFLIVYAVLMPGALQQMLSLDVEGSSAGFPFLFVLMTLVGMVGGFWILIVQCRALAEAQGFSSWKAFGTILITGIVSSVIGSFVQAVLGGVAVAILGAFV
ncbi:MAG: Yip1 family protein [Deinococcota bacterium]